jgi:tetratricopeptide (TPR) repeat protein
LNTALQNQLQDGIRLLKTGQLDQARTLANSMLQQFPESPEAYLYAADAASLRGDRKGAIAFVDQILERQPALPQLLVRKAQLLFNDSQRSEALTVARQVAASGGQNEWLVRSIGRILSDCHDLEGARNWLQSATENLPESRAILADLAVAEFQMNLPGEAEQHIGALLDLEPFHPGALHLRSLLSTQTEAQNHIVDLQDRLSRGPDHPNLVTAACYALTKEYEDLGRYQESYEALQRGAAAYRSTLQYDSTAELSAHEDIRSRFTKSALESLTPGYGDDGPIFVVGMPRTGTTLVERLLGSHSQVTSIGEFTDFPMMLQDLAGELQAQQDDEQSVADISLALDFHELGRRYVEAARDLAGDSPRFVDKLPFNFLYCGYVQASLPKAKLINLTRDPLDTCYAVYKTLFFGAYLFSYDLEELADYYISYRRQMEHWHEVLPGGILDVSYEALVQNPEAEARRILDWCGLDWEPEVLDFHTQDVPAMTASAMQVRQSFYTESIGNWRRAGSGFDGIRQKLETAGILEAAPQPPV